MDSNTFKSVRRASIILTREKLIIVQHLTNVN